MTLTYAKPAVQDAWADQAVPTTDIVQPSNSFVASGWLESTVPPARQYFNWALNWPSAGIRYFCQRGIVDFDSAETYQGGAYVQYGGVVYVSLAANNQGHIPPNQYWAVAFTTPAALTSALAAYVTTTYLYDYFWPITTIQTEIAGFATIYSPNFEGNPTVPTPAFGDDDTSIANTSFVQTAILNAAPNGYAAQNGWMYFYALRLYFMWGFAPFTGTSPQLVTFPKAGGFPNAIFSVVVTPTDGSGAPENFCIESFSPTGFSVSSGSGLAFCWIAIGN